MRQAWRLAINSLSARPSRSILLLSAVALSAALVVAVSFAMATANKAVENRIDVTVGAGDVTLRGMAGGSSLPGSVLDDVRAWPEVKLAVPRLEADLGVEIFRPVYELDEGAWVANQTRLRAVPQANGIDPATEYQIRPLELIEGQLPEGPDDVVIDELLAERLSYEWTTRGPSNIRDMIFGFRPTPSDVDAPPEQAISTAEEAEAWNVQQRVGVGDTLRVTRGLATIAELKVVGIAKLPFGGKPNMFLRLPTLQQLTRASDKLTKIDVVLRRGSDPAAVVEDRADELPDDLILQTTARVTSGLDQNLKSSQLGFILASVLAAMSSAFIILTGLNTNVTEQQRGLAILRCIGGSRAQLSASQVVLGLVIGTLGAALGIPLGFGIALIVWLLFREQLPGGLETPLSGPVLGGAGAIVAGLVGAAWPAYRVARMSPLMALASRASAPSPKGVVIVSVIGLAFVLAQILIISLPESGQVMFWAYATVGLPLMFVGYFLLSVPLTLVAARVAAPVVSRLFTLPPRVLERTISATPYRHGFTAGAMMGGLALMVSIWTNGGAMLRDWLDKIEFPDAFVSGLNLREECQTALDEMPFIENTCAITLHPVETDAFGVRALQNYRTSFLAFEPERFFRMTKLQWVQGDPETAKRKLEAGGAIIVSREFLVAQGLGVGDDFVCSDLASGESHTFEIAGVVSSPGLEVVSKFFNIGREYHQQALHAVFGSRKDLVEKFGTRAINLIQIDLADTGPNAIDDERAVELIRERMFELNAGVADAGSGRWVKREIRVFATGLLFVFSGVAVMAMLVACFGVANLVIASIESRRFEFGVLRSVGGSRGLLTRLVVGEAVIVALTAALLGTLLGLQGSLAGQRLYALLLGITLHFRPPTLAIAAGWLVVLALTLGAAWPAIWRLSRIRPRELLATMKG